MRHGSFVRYKKKNTRCGFRSSHSTKWSIQRTLELFIIVSCHRVGVSSRNRALSIRQKPDL